VRLEAEVEKSSNLQKSLKELQNICLNFGNRCVQRLRQVFNSVGVSSEKFEPSVEDLPSTFEHIESEVEFLDEVIARHGDFLCPAGFSRHNCSFYEGWLYARKNSKQTELQPISSGPS
jgi:hypothetical protein